MTEQNAEAGDSDGVDEEYADLGATTQEAMDIAETSMDIVRQFVPDETLADRFRQKAVHSMGDIEFQHLLRFTGTDSDGNADAAAPIRAGARAVNRETTIVTDITMSKAGVTGRGHNCEKRKAIGNGAELAKETGMTRTAASVTRRRPPSRSLTVSKTAPDRPSSSPRRSASSRPSRAASESGRLPPLTTCRRSRTSVAVAAAGWRPR